MILISLTTIPPRFNNIFEKLYNFYNEQLLKPDKIILNICYYYKRFNNDTINIDKMDYFYLKLTEMNILIINYSEDYGALTKLYPTIIFINENYKNTFVDIITIDDDCTYKDDMIELLINYSIKYNKTTVLGFFGFNLGNFNNVGIAYRPSIENHCKKIDVIGGVNGIYYNSSFFTNIDLYTKYINNLSFEDYLCDDEVSNMYMKYINIDRIIINANTFKTIDRSAYATYALHKNNVRNRQNNTLHNCINILQKIILN